MQIRYEQDGVYVECIPHFSLEETLTCGQCFRFELGEDGCWSGIVRGNFVRLRSLKDGMILMNCSRETFEGLWLDYFDLNRDYEIIRSEFMQDPMMRMCAEYAPGIRILHQDAWEALISFIISANNNVPRIQGIVKRLCELAGDTVEGGYSFPTAQQLAGMNEEALAPLRAGWRVGYILDAAKRVEDGRLDLDKIAKLPIQKARESLMTVKGVGPKVAECVLLYGMGRMEAFPMDVWMKRAMASLFPGKKPENFGKYAGIAQQYIFHYSRMQKIG